MSNIREFAERRGLKMADIARITGISESMLSLIDSGKRNVTPNQQMNCNGSQYCDQQMRMIGWIRRNMLPKYEV